MFAITRCIWQGPFASPKRLLDLRAAGITHILNVCEASSVLRVEDGPFAEVSWIPVDDLERMPDKVALECVDTLHRMLCVDGGKVYVHCITGWNRSPTVVWLYLVACGIDPQAAKERITDSNRDGIPGHHQLVDAALVNLMQEHGRTLFLPHPRLIALDL